MNEVQAKSKQSGFHSFGAQENASASDPVNEYTATETARKPVRTLTPLLPAILGLGLAQGVFGATAYSSSAYSEHPLAPDLATAVSSLIMIILIGALGLRKTPLRQRTATVLVSSGVLLQILSSFALAGADILAPNSFEVALAFSVCAAAGNALIVAHWLRAIKDAPITFVIAAMFSSMIVSELLCTVLAQFAHPIACAVAAICACLHILLIQRKIDVKSLPSPFEEKTEQPNYLDIARKQGYDPLFLLNCGFAIIVISVTESILWGFPYGEAQTVSGLERLLGGCFSIVMLFIKMCRERSRSQGTLSTWLWLLVLGLLSLFSYAAFPSLPIIGLAFLIAFSDIATAYGWCIIIAFMEKGRHDPHAYALGGTVAILLPGAIARGLALAFLSPVASAEGFHSSGDMLLAAVLGALIMTPSLIVLEGITRKQSEEISLTKSASAALLHTFGISEQPSKPTDMRRIILEKSIAKLKTEFNLSVRESEVLTLYALGFTQNRIARKLHISPNTAHSHISRIYTKTDLHSRQELIDYLDTIACAEEA